MKQTAARVIRVATVPPLMALVLALILWGNGVLPPAGALRIILFLSVLPTLAYPVWAAVPSLRARGRDSQRPLAVIFSVAGYLAGTAVCLCGCGGRTELLLFLSYLISGGLIALFSFAFKVMGSGHAAGTAGPVTVLICLLGPWYALGGAVLAAVFWSSLVLKRHTLLQLVLGSLFSAAAVVLLFAIL